MKVEVGDIGWFSDHEGSVEQLGTLTGVVFNLPSPYQCNGNKVYRYFIFASEEFVKAYNEELNRIKSMKR